MGDTYNECLQATERRDAKGRKLVWGPIDDRRFGGRQVILRAWKVSEQHPIYPNLL